MELPSVASLTHPATAPDTHPAKAGEFSSLPLGQFTWITTEKAGDYYRILRALHLNRRAHKSETYHDDLLLDTLADLPPHRQTSYTVDHFRADVATLEGWGCIKQRMEPHRIETLGDRKRARYLVRLDEFTVHVLDFLDAEAQRATTFIDRGRHLLQDAAEFLEDAHERASPLAEGGGADEDWVRFAYLIAEADVKVGESSRELASFDANLIEFARQPFRLDAIPQVAERLETYVEDYIESARETRARIHKATKKLRVPRLVAVLGEAQARLTESLRRNPLSAPASAVKLDDVLERSQHYFRPGGTFEELLERVHRAAREVVRRVQSHIEEVRRRNIRIETLRDRTRDIARTSDDDAPQVSLWISELYHSAHLVSDLRTGTPVERAAPPLPAKRHEATRPPFRGSYLEPKKGVPGEAKQMERDRIREVNAFMEQRVLKGAQTAELGPEAVGSFRDVRTLMDAYKLHFLKGGKRRRALTFGMELGEGEPPRFAVPEGDFATPATKVKKKEAKTT